MVPGQEFWAVITGIAAAITAIAVVASAMFHRSNTLYMKQRDMPSAFGHVQYGENGLSWLNFRISAASNGPEWTVTSVSVRGGTLKKCVNSQAVYPLCEQNGLEAQERRYTAHEEGKH